MREPSSVIKWQRKRRVRVCASIVEAIQLFRTDSIVNIEPERFENRFRFVIVVLASRVLMPMALNDTFVTYELLQL